MAETIEAVIRELNAKIVEERGLRLAMEPKVLLLDEPFGALDALTRAHLQDELAKLVTATGSTVVMVTHDVDEAVLLSDREVMMTNGPAALVRLSGTLWFLPNQPQV